MKCARGAGVWIWVFLSFSAVAISGCTFSADGGVETGNPSEHGGTETGNPDQHGGADPVGQGSTQYLVNPQELTLGAVVDNKVDIQASSQFLTLGMSLDPSRVTVVVKRNGEVKKILTERDFSAGTTAFTAAITALPSDTVQFDINVESAAEEDASLKATVGSLAVHPVEITPDVDNATTPDNPGIQIVDEICERIVTCFGATTVKACKVGVESTKQIDDAFGLSADNAYYFNEVVESVDSGTVNVDSDKAESCVAAIESIPCGDGVESSGSSESITVAAGYDPTAGKHNYFDGVDKFIPTATDSCGATMSGDPTSDRVINPATDLGDKICERLYGCFKATTIEECNDGIRVTQGLAAQFGIQDPTLSFQSLIDGVEGSAYGMASDVYDRCVADLEALSCSQLATGYNSADPYNFKTLGAFIPNGMETCGNVFDQSGVMSTPSADTDESDGQDGSSENSGTSAENKTDESESMESSVPDTATSSQSSGSSK